MGQNTKLIKSLHNFKKQISKEYFLHSMYLFGSRASGKARKDSDVDLLLISPIFRGKRRLKRSPSLYLKWNLDYPVDFICLTPEEFQKKKKQIGIVREAIESGIEI